MTTMMVDAHVWLQVLVAQRQRQRLLMIDTIITTQAKEGIETTWAQAAWAYDKVREGLKGEGP